MIKDKYFNEIEISNFRGFDHVMISDLTKLNVFVGANDVGKTSILEAVFMLVGMSNPEMPMRVNHWRLLSSNTLDYTRYLFHNVDFQNPPLLIARNDDKIRKLTFTPVMSNQTDSASSETVNTSVIKQLNFDFDTKDDVRDLQCHSKLFIDSTGKMQQKTDDNYKENLNCLFISADKNDGNASANFAKLVKMNKKQIIVDALKEFDENIISVEALPEGLFLLMKGQKELLPISMVGDGARRLLNILSTIECEDYNIVMIDELDNGLHYSAHKLIWKTLLNFIKERDIQLFITTHNLECLQSLNAVLRDDDSIRDLACVYNISKTKLQGFQAYRYSFDNLQEAITNEIEIR